MAQWRGGGAQRSQLRGQSRIWCLLATPHRVPFSSRLPLAPRTIPSIKTDPIHVVNMKTPVKKLEEVSIEQVRNIDRGHL